MTCRTKRILFTIATFVTVCSLSCESKQPAPLGGSTQGPSKPQGQTGRSPFDTTWVLVQRGQTLDEILASRLPEPAARAELVRTFSRVWDPRSIRAGSEIGLVSSSEGELEGLIFRPQIWKTVGVWKDSLAWKEFERQLPVRTEVHHLCGTVTTTVYDAFLERGADPELVMLFSDIFQWDIDFFIDPKPGDEFRVIYEVHYVETDTGITPIGYGKILAAQYVLKGKPLSAIYFENPNGKSGYYDQNGRSFQKAFLKSPLNYRRITSYFTGERFHPIFKRVRPHYAVDFAAPEGTPVVAAGDGIVVEAGWDKGLGNYIRIRHTNPRYETLYGHLRSFARGIRKGARVRQNQVIGYVGKTGIATGPHLHYAFYENGRPINPLRIRRVTGDPVPRSAMPAFVKMRDKMLRQLASIRPRPHILYAWSGWPFPPLPNAISVPRP